MINTRDVQPRRVPALRDEATDSSRRPRSRRYDRSRRDGIIAINLRDGDELIAVRRVKDGETVMMVSTAGKAIMWDEADARPMGRDTMGVKGMNVKKDERGPRHGDSARTTPSCSW